MHILAPQPPSKTAPIFFNVDSSVGHNAENSRPEDIMLVQFFMRKSAERGLARHPDLKQRLLRVVVDGRCGPITIDGIRATQENMKETNPGTVVDGRVSRARGYLYDRGGGGFWTIVILSNTFRDKYREYWPRLQSVPGCPALLKAEAERCL